MGHLEIERTQQNYLAKLTMKEYKETYNFKTMRKLFELCGSGNAILDVGCGDGFIARILMDNGNEVTGVEMMDSAIKIARKKGVKVVKAKAQALPFKSGSFDIVVMAEVIEHFLETDGAFREARRVLKKGGKIIITTPNFASLRDRVLLLFGKLQAFAQHSDHVKFLNKERLVLSLQRAKFQGIKVYGSCFGFPFAHGRAVEVFFLDGMLPATWMQCLIAEGTKRK